MQCTGKPVRWIQTKQPNLPVLTLASTGLKEVLLTATLTYISVLLLIHCHIITLESQQPSTMHSELPAQAA